ncbi:MAG: HtaA domain-containing protein [Microbacterium sp.]|uniref:HtaA domain-containing protein n=1 Tax=Microbacterium sp. TaxID=51671 RepID=UPI003F9D0531
MTQPTFTVDVTEVANERIDIAIEGEGYDDVQALPGQTEPHAYFTLIEKDSDLSEVGQADTAISAEVEADGTLSDVLSVPAGELVEGTSYEVISWPSRSFPTAENLYARTDITIDWAALFPGEEEPGEEEPGEEEPGEEDPGEEGPGEEDSDENDPGADQPGEEPTSPEFTTAVTEVPGERIDIAIEGAGYGDVQPLPGQAGPHAYFTVIEKDSDLAAVEDTQAAISASIDDDGRISDVLPIPAENLDASKDYEVISWPTRSFPAEANLYARADIAVNWNALFPGGAPERATVTLTASSSSAYVDQEIELTARIAPDVGGTVTFWNGTERLGSAVQTTNGTAGLTTKNLPVGDHSITARFVPDPDGYAESVSNRVSVTISERSAEGSLQWGVKSNFRSYVTGDIAGGRITVAEGAKQATGNGVFTFPQATSGSTWNGQTGTVQYAGQVTFYGHSGALNHTIANPSIQVTSTTSADLRINYNGTTIVFATIDLSQATRQGLTGDAVRFSGAPATLTRAGAQFFSYQGHEFYSPGEELDRVTFTIGQASDVGVTEPPTTPEDHGNENPNPPDNTPAPAAAQDSAGAGSLRWGVSSAFVAYTTCEGMERFGYSHCAKGSISTSGVGNGYLFPQATGSDWDAESQTGTVRYSGVVSFQGYGMTMFAVSNPSITVHDPTSATLHTGNTANFGASSYPLDLSSATKTEGENGAMTWSGVGVEGSLTGGPGGGSSNSVGFDDLTFTVGTASSDSFGSTSAGDEDTTYTAAESVPTTAGLEVLTPADQIRAGGRIQLQASGFDADDPGVLVVLYGTGDDTGPIVLDEDAAADADGLVTWSGTLPDDVTGDHVITLQGSIDAGAEIEILERETSASAGTAAVVPSGGGEAAATGPAQPVPTGGMALWEWWTIAASLVAIAGCTSLLAIRQRRALTAVVAPA